MAQTATEARVKLSNVVSRQISEDDDVDAFIGLKDASATHAIWRP